MPEPTTLPLHMEIVVRDPRTLAVLDRVVDRWIADGQQGTRELLRRAAATEILSAYCRSVR